MAVRTRGLLAAAILLAAALPSFAAVTFTTHDGAVTSTGLPVAAKLEVTVQPDELVVRLHNTTSDVRALEQTLRGVSFSVYNKKAVGDLKSAAARTVNFTASGLNVSSSAEDPSWSMDKAGDTYVLRSPGLRHTVLPEPDSAAGYKAADASVTTPGGREFVGGPVEFHIAAPGLTQSDDIINVHFHWATQDEGFTEPRISGGTGGADPLQHVNSEFSTPGEIQIVPQDPPVSESLASPTRAFLDAQAQPGYIYHDVQGGAPGMASSGSSNNNNNTGPAYDPSNPSWGLLTNGNGQEVGPNGVPPIGPVLASDGSNILTGSPYLTPNGIPPISVPEPASVALIGMGVLWLLSRPRTRRA